MRKYIFTGIIAVGLAFGGYWVFKLNSSTRAIPTAAVTQGQFLVSLTANGQLGAKRSITIYAPRIRGNLQIVKMTPEGTMVNKGDFLIQFEQTTQETTLRDATAELKIAEANLERAKAQYEMDLKQLELDMKKAERSFTEKQSEAPIIRKEAELELDLSRMKYDTQKRILETDIQKQEVEVGKARDKKDLAARDLGNMTQTAPIPGLVVYLEIWKGGTMAKVQEGDNPWSGQGLIDLPDLSVMVVETSVSEVDVSKLQKGLRCEIRLDAVPGPVFTGQVTDIGTLAHPKAPGSEINVFDVEVLVDSTDSRLKPGMSAKADIIINEFADVISVPIEAVFERDDTTVVYTPGGKKIPVALGTRNATSVVVTSGLKPGEEICLVDPTRRIEDAATGTQKPPNPQAQSGKSSRSTMIIVGD